MHIQVANEYVYGAPGTGSTILDTEDFSGMAGFLLTTEDVAALKYSSVPNELLSTTLTSDGKVLCDLIVTDVTFAYTDHNRIHPYVGDFFSVHFFGKAPMVLNVQGTLLDTSHNFGKEVMQSWYQHVFRLSKVALTGVAPHLCFRGYMVQGALLGLTMTESVEIQGLVNFSFEFLVFNLKLNNPTNTSLGQTGVEIEYNRVLTPSVYEEAQEAQFSMKEIQVSAGGEVVSVTEGDGTTTGTAGGVDPSKEVGMIYRMPTSGPYKASQFACTCRGKYCKDNKISPRLIQILNESAKILNETFSVNSGYRCVRRNLEVGGAANSQHVYGTAADLRMSPSKFTTVARVMRSLGITGIGYYYQKGFLHVDIRSGRAEWTG